MLLTNKAGHPFFFDLKKRCRQDSFNILRNSEDLISRAWRGFLFVPHQFRWLSEWFGLPVGEAGGSPRAVFIKYYLISVSRAQFASFRKNW